jgi:hypothetical protein
MAGSRFGLGSFCHPPWAAAASNQLWRFVIRIMNCPILLTMLLSFGVVLATAQSPTGDPSTSPTTGAQPAPQQVPGQQPAPSLPETTADKPEPSAAPKNPVPKMQAPKESEGNTTVSGVSPSEQSSPKPETEILDSSATSTAVATDGHDPVLDPPPFPRGATTLVGGIISGVDRIRNHLTVSIFGGGSWTVYFDERTHIFHNGAEVTPLALKKGERVYVDTMLDNNKHDIFARNIRVGVVTPPADAAGQIVEVDTAHRELILRDNINSASVRFGVDTNTLITHGSKPATFQDLVPGTLVQVQFAPDRSNRGLARQIVILAIPGTAFTFAGTVTFLDTHRNLLSLHNSADDKSYDIYFVPSRTDLGRLAVGAEVQIRAVFETTHYSAQQITVTRMAGTSSR